mgnify:CR=1 FL=1
MHAERPPAAIAALRRWAIDSALPLWATAGFDRIHRRFEERLTIDGRAIVDVPVRLMVQARQIYVYGLAARAGWHGEAAALVETAFGTMVREYYRADRRDGWVFSLHRDGTVADGKRDLYAHAFVLLSVASYVEATGQRGALDLANETLAFIDSAMRAGNGGGYVEALPPSGELRRQNPHMHLFEALLALWRVTHDGKYLFRAEEIFALFRDRFFRARDGVLIEYFDSALRPLGDERGDIVEPGHHYEWVWLLRQFEAATGREVQGFVDALYSHADRYGFAPSGLIVDELLADGTVKTASHRVWPVTEAIKANAVEGGKGRPGAERRAVALIQLLFARFLTATAAGGWIDRRDQGGAPATDFMPASTLYHVICALDVLLTTSSKG